MARYKHIDTSPRFIAVDLQRQLLPGTIEHALNYLLDHQIDLTGLDARFCNDATGAAAYPPAMLLKIILFAYSQGIISSRNIERACREHVAFIALSGDTAPHFTTIATFTPIPASPCNLSSLCPDSRLPGFWVYPVVAFPCADTFLGSRLPIRELFSGQACGRKF